MRISDWSSDVCSSDLLDPQVLKGGMQVIQRLGEAGVIDEWLAQLERLGQRLAGLALLAQQALAAEQHVAVEERVGQCVIGIVRGAGALVDILGEEVQLQVAADFRTRPRSEEHTSELQSLMRISYAVFCLKTKIKPTT